MGGKSPDIWPVSCLLPGDISRELDCNWSSLGSTWSSGRLLVLQVMALLRLTTVPFALCPSPHKAGRDGVFHQLVHSPKPAYLRLGQSRSQDPGTTYRSPIQVAGTQVLEQTLLLPPRGCARQQAELKL